MTFNSYNIKQLQEQVKILKDTVKRHQERIDDLENYLHHVERQDSAGKLEQKINNLYCKSEGLTATITLYNDQQAKYKMTILCDNSYSKDIICEKIVYLYEIEQMLKKGELGMCEIERAIAAWKWHREHTVTCSASNVGEYTSVCDFVKKSDIEEKSTKKKKK